MKDMLAMLVGGGAWMPHGHCYFWQADVLWLNVISDLLVAAAYFSLPVALIYFVVKRRDLMFKPLFVMFGVFILACGMTHVMGAVTIWVPAYWVSGGLKAVTAAVSLITATMVWFYIPRALALPSPTQLRKINSDLEQLNQQLHTEVASRKETEEQFRLLLESAPDAIVIVNKEGEITLINSQTEKWFGYTRDELVGKPVETLVPERLREKHVVDRGQYIEAPLVRPMGAGLELYGVRKDGREFPVEISLSPLKTKQEMLVISVIRDITARKNAEQAQQQVELRYKDLVNNLPVGVYRSTDGNKDRFIEVNPALADILQSESVEGLLDKSASEFYADNKQYEAFRKKLRENGHVKAEEVELEGFDGRRFFASITAVLKQDVNRGDYIDGILEDISARKEDETRIRQLNESLKNRTSELEVINQELESFSYSVSHDLRAPLRAIDGFSRILLRDNSEILSEKSNELLERIRNAAQNMAGLIDDLLNLSRVSRAKLKCESIELEKICTAIVDDLRQISPDRTVQVNIQSGLEAKGDANLIKIVMDNLLGNAWKFTEQEERAEIEVGARDMDGEVVYFVSDNGAGFDMNYSDKLFGAFQRLHDAESYSGTGIGLATVQRIIHKHGGRVWAEGEVSNGATFYFTLSRECEDGK